MKIEEIKKYLIFEAYRGSFAYGTYIEGFSDKDKIGVYVQPLDEIMGIDTYIPQIQDEKGDCIYYEIRRFLELLYVSNPTMLETVFFDEECIIYKHSAFDCVLNNRNKFVTKLCKNAFFGYASQQIAKARGLNKKQNWEKNKITRKEPIDFCYIIDSYNSYPLQNFLQEHKMDQKFCGVINVPNARDLYAIFYDWEAHKCFSELESKLDKDKYKESKNNTGDSMGLGYKGITKIDEGTSVSKSNTLRLSSIPNGEKCVSIFTYNKDSYTKSCKDYREYQEWLKNRNTNRWTETVNHNQTTEDKVLIDGKNMLHCKRLIDMSIEIAQGKGVIVRRPDAQYLLKIRRGEVSLDELLKESEDKISRMDELFANSTLPDSVDKKIVNSLLLQIRKEIYNENTKNE